MIQKYLTKTIEPQPERIHGELHWRTRKRMHGHFEAFIPFRLSLSKPGRQPHQPRRKEWACEQGLRQAQPERIHGELHWRTHGKRMHGHVEAFIPFNAVSDFSFVLKVPFHRSG
jgi:hypothetical protein